MTLVKNKDLEVIRGFAALMVFLCHLIDKVELPAFKKYFFFRLIGNWGTDSVIIFFILSGIVIGISQENKERTFLAFMRNRLVRILPVYLIGVLLGIVAEIMLTGSFSSWRQLWPSLGFVSTLQGYVGFPLEYVAIIWSLSFEMFFYLTFAFTIGKHQKILLIIWMVIALLAIPIHMFVQIDSKILRYLLAMFSYSFLWLLGYFVFQIRMKWKVSHWSMLLSLGSLPLISRLHITDQYYDVIKYGLFGIFSIPMFQYFLNTQRSKVYKWLVPLQLIGIIAAVIHLMLFSESLLISKLIYITLPFILLVTALKFDWLIALFSPIRSLGSWLGSVSYALYIVHYPVLFILAYYLRDHLYWVPFCSLLIFAISYFLDLKMQPLVSRILGSNYR